MCYVLLGSLDCQTPISLDARTSLLLEIDNLDTRGISLLQNNMMPPTVPENIQSLKAYQVSHVVMIQHNPHQTTPHLNIKSNPQKPG
jgi:hypothetical protein